MLKNIRVFRGNYYMKKKLQIRQIHDIHGESYKIYDILTKDVFGEWRYNKETYFNLDDALRFNKGIEIEDLTK